MFHLPSSPIISSPSGSCNSPPSFVSRRASSDFRWDLGGYSTSPSSVASIPSDGECAEWNCLERQTNEFVHRLLRKEKESEVALGAWRIRCQTLEEEVSRLALLLDKVEKERDEARREAKQACAHKATVFEQVQTDSSTTPHRPRLPFRFTDTPSSRPQIDPSKPMSKQAPAPCNSLYLLGHCDVPRCRYEHRYELTDEQIEEMRRGAKHHVCNAIKNGVECPDGEDCIFGHFCPRGPACGRERCGFNDEQHRVIPPPRPVVRRRC